MSNHVCLMFFLPSKSIVCYIYWMYLHLLMIVLHSAAYTKDVCSSLRYTSTWSPTTFCVTECSDSFLLFSLVLDHTSLTFLELLCLEIILGCIIRIYTCIACVKEQVASQLLESLIYLYIELFFLSLLDGAFRQDFSGW